MKLNNRKVMALLYKKDRPVSWLAKTIGVSSQVLHYNLREERIKYVDKMAKALKVKSGVLVKR